MKLKLLVMKNKYAGATSSFKCFFWSKWWLFFHPQGEPIASSCKVKRSWSYS